MLQLATAHCSQITFDVHPGCIGQSQQTYQSKFSSCVDIRPNHIVHAKDACVVLYVCLDGFEASAAYRVVQGLKYQVFCGAVVYSSRDICECIGCNN
jgi:hypothetical protein